METCGDIETVILSLSFSLVKSLGARRLSSYVAWLLEQVEGRPGDPGLGSLAKGNELQGFRSWNERLRLTRLIQCIPSLERKHRRNELS